MPYKDKEKRKKQSKEYREKNKDNIKKYIKKWREENPDYDKKRYQKKYKNNAEFKEKNKMKCKKYYEDHKDNPEYKLKRKEYFKEYALKDKEKIRKKKWEEEHSDYRNRYFKTENGKLSKKKSTQKRRALKKKAKDTLTNKELKIIQNRDKNCVYCGSNRNLEFDHIISLNNGGENSFLNGAMACGICNRSKRDKNVFTWCKSKGYKVPEIVINNLKNSNKI